MTRVPTAMTIAGSDSGAGAGVQADLKTFAALGVYGTSVLTAVTAQNTRQVTDMLELPTSLIGSQIDAVMADIGADAVKTGMLSSSEVVAAVAEKVRLHRLERLVVDPVMVAKAGDRLLRADAVEALRTLLIPLARVVTPNGPEAEVLTGRRVETLDDAKKAARDLVGMGATAAIVKGGHLGGAATDTLYDGGDFIELTSPRVETTSDHGTGCTFASAITAGLAKGLDLAAAAALAKEYVTAALRHAFPMGRGHGPLNHFYELWGMSKGPG